MQKNIIRIAITTGLILLIPFFGNMYVDGWDWSFFDFIFAGVLIFGTGLTYVLVTREMSDRSYRFAVGLGVITALILIWMNGAVGIIGNEDNPANLMYIGVLIIGAIGSAISRLEPRGMSKTLFAMAFAQALVPAIALIIWRPDFSPGVLGVFVLNAVFVTSWIVSAIMFRHSSQDHNPPLQR